MTGSKIGERLMAEASTSVNLKVTPLAGGGESFEVQARGELQLGLLMGAPELPEVPLTLQRNSGSGAPASFILQNFARLHSQCVITSPGISLEGGEYRGRSVPHRQD